MNIQHSEPIFINNGLRNNHLGLGSSDHTTYKRVRHDTLTRIKASLEPRSRTSSLSPSLASPTPPTYVPDGSHEISVIENYCLVENVEGNNSGNVFRAIDYNTDNEFICKVYDCNDYRQAVDRYARVDKHPHINYVVDIVNFANNVYVFFKSGVSMLQSHSEENEANSKGFKAENLHTYVRSKKKLSEAVAASLFTQVVEAVSYCHENNIVLRDLKLRKFIFKDHERENVMLESLDDAWVCDGDDDQLTYRRGCPAYASPEMVCNTSSKDPSGMKGCCGYSGKPSDVWSLGVMLYTMLVGRYPFLDNDPISLFAKINRCQFTMPDSLSHEARDLIRNLLRHKPSQRLAARDILDHPWLKRKGICWDTPRNNFFLGSGGDNRRVDRAAIHQFGRHTGGHSFPSSIFSVPYYEDQMVPDVDTSNSSQDLLFSFAD